MVKAIDRIGRGADAFEGVHLRAKAAGADSLMTKPFELPALVGEVRRLIGPGYPAATDGGGREQDQLGA